MGLRPTIQNPLLQRGYSSFNSIYYTSTSSSSCSPHIIEDEEEDTKNSAVDRTSTSASSTAEDPPPPPPPLKDSISKKRFFFSPCTTKSIMDEARTASEGQPDLGVEEIEVSEMGFGKDTVLMAMASEDPYLDFKASMEEMVEAHGLREWSCLQELLHCYLRLNDRRTHRAIVLAFVDLLMSQFDKEGIHKEGLFALSPQFSVCLDELGGLNRRFE
ncbi:hypothetical protein QJS10_CPA03g01955 [Acorus calamus]|uniref:Transcription repressor n=1 Tax=Acorus calamus TaxID=4465 RepID=A0AAV9F7D8_ACOCL|nr:hypothetical protein QJS10_CPA03g01955 [Acorus calamus]